MQFFLTYGEPAALHPLSTPGPASGYHLPIRVYHQLGGGPPLSSKPTEQVDLSPQSFSPGTPPPGFYILIIPAFSLCSSSPGGDSCFTQSPHSSFLILSFWLHSGQLYVRT